MYCIGLTGGIASGKSTVSSYFLTLDIDVISADHMQTRPVMTDDQVVNNGSIEQLQEKVDALHRQYLYCALLNDLNDIRNNATLPGTPWE